MNTWQKRCVFNLDLNREFVWTPNVIRKAIPEFESQYKKALPLLVDFTILGTTKSPEFCDLRERFGL